VTRILIAEDESQIASFLEKGLRAQRVLDHVGRRRAPRGGAGP